MARSMTVMHDGDEIGSWDGVAGERCHPGEEVEDLL
jgi:hypothetical protein